MTSSPILSVSPPPGALGLSAGGTAGADAGDDFSRLLASALQGKEPGTATTSPVSGPTQAAPVTPLSSAPAIPDAPPTDGAISPPLNASTTQAAPITLAAADASIQSDGAEGGATPVAPQSTLLQKATTALDPLESPIQATAPVDGAIAPADADAAAGPAAPAPEPTAIDLAAQVDDAGAGDATQTAPTPVAPPPSSPSAVAIALTASDPALAPVAPSASRSANKAAAPSPAAELSASQDANASVAGQVAAASQKTTRTQINASAQGPDLAGAPSAGSASPTSAAGPDLPPPSVSGEIGAAITDPPLAAPLGAEQSSAGRPAPRLPVAAQAVAATVRQFDGRSGSFEIRMDPPELGRVDVRIDVNPDRTVQATFSAETVQTLNDLMRAQREIERALAEAGLNVAQGGIGFDFTRRDAHADGRPNHPDTDQGGGSLEDADAPLAAAPIAWSRWGSAGVDVWA